MLNAKMIDRDSGTRDTVPYHIWKHEVQMAAIRAGADAAEVMSIEKLPLWYSAGEPYGWLLIRWRLWRKVQ